MRRPRIVLKLIDGLQYGIVLTAVAFVLLLPISVATAGDLVLVKFGLFLLGMLLMGIGATKARPRQRTAADRTDDWRPRLSRMMPSESYSDDGFGGLVNRLPPAAWYVGPGDRLSDGGRFLVAWVVAWAVSFLMEAVFNVGVPPPLR